MKTYDGVEVYFHAFLTLALCGGKWLVSRSGHFTLGGDPGTIGWEAA